MEKFIVSARKYRPQTFDTVVGQEHITTTLKNAIKNGQLAHAFLFCGPRGVGKTTCARILAKTINCEKISGEGEACNSCASCRSFNEGSSLNIHELDAASNNSVDDIRNLVDQVRFAPQAGKYKVYIIDEVHMLSSSAFNAFLKTLEEPPPYAIFILATTEKHKILPTILSRCQIFDFKRITLQDTVKHLQRIAEKEKFATEETALQLIAQKSEGCMRDALSILDKIVSFTNGQVTYENTIEHLNILDADYYFRLFDCMMKQDLAGAMLLYDDIDKKGFEGDMVLTGFSEFIRNLLICKDERVAGLLEVVESFRQRFAETARRTDAGYLVASLNILNESEINYRGARNKRLHVELALIKLCYLRQAFELTANGSSLDKKKLTETARPVAFKQIQPIAVSDKKESSAKLLIENATGEKQRIKPVRAENRSDRTTDFEQISNSENVSVLQNGASEPITTQVIERIRVPVSASHAATETKGRLKIGSLEAIRQKIEKDNCDEQTADQPLQMDALKKAWLKHIEFLKENKNPAWQSFEVASLHIKDPNCFEAIVHNNINQKFLEFERNKVSAFLQKELCNRQLQFTITFFEGQENNAVADIPLSSREQFQKLVEQYPLVKELRDRLKLDLDY